MNEVEVAPVPEEKHVWVQPRVVRPTKPKKAPAVNYMSESGPVSALGLPLLGWWARWGRPGRCPGQQTVGAV